MAKDKFIHKTGSGPEQCVVSQVTLPVTATEDRDIRRCYTIHAQGVEYRWIRVDPSGGSFKVSADAFEFAVWRAKAFGLLSSWRRTRNKQ